MMPHLVLVLHPHQAQEETPPFDYLRKQVQTCINAVDQFVRLLSVQVSLHLGQHPLVTILLSPHQTFPLKDHL